MTERDQAARQQEAANEALNALYSGMDVWCAFALGLPLTLTAETMRFVGRRLQADADHLVELRTCRTVEEVVKRQSTFMSKTVSDYQAEAATLSEDVRQAVYRRAA